MSTNCLVTKLKDTVNNDNLEILGEKNLTFGINSIPGNTKNGNICFVFDVPSYVIPNKSILYKNDAYASADKVFNVSENEIVDIPAAASEEAKILRVNSTVGGIMVIRATDTSNVKLRVGNKYNVSGIGVNYCNINKSEVLNLLKYSNNLKYFTIRYSTIDSVLSLDEVLENINTPENLKVISFEAVNVQGDISQLGVFINSGYFVLSGTNITGSVESFVEALIENNKPDKNLMQLSVPPANLTINGEQLSSGNIYVTFNQGAATVYNTNKTTVLASYDGTSWSYPS